MIFVKFLYYKIYSFYNRFWPNNDPELYAYFAVSLLLSLNLFSLHFGYVLMRNPIADVNKYTALIVLAFVLVLCYFCVIRHGYYKEISDASFKIKGPTANTFVIIYVIVTILIILSLAYLRRQYHLNL